MGEREAWESGVGDWIGLVRSSTHPHEHDAVLRELLPVAAGLTIDVGCGEGRWTRELAELGYDVVGVDRSNTLVDAAREADPTGRYEVAAAEELPFADGAVSFVLCVNVLMHIVDLEQVVREFARVLERGGTLVAGLAHPVMEAGTFDEASGELRISSYFAEEEHLLPLGEHHVAHHHRTIEGYLRALLGNGFTLDDLREVPGRTGGTPKYLDLRLTRA
ncbi:MAG TPA: class I SAM-dependent methyltransferase [Gaiellaceae bacterium]|nr:class I SAM-dependent methyltransferase [Gaiellaceae bacterium]